MGRRALPKDDLYDLVYLKGFYERHSIPNPKTGCVDWNAGFHPQGYGMVGAWRKSDGSKIMTTTHRIAARRKLGRGLESSEFVVHTCGNPKCVNEDHLTVGDMYTVRAEMKRRGYVRGPNKKKK